MTQLAPRINPMLFKLATQRVWDQASNEKRAFQPPGGGMPPGGAPPAAGGPMPGGGAPPPVPPMDPAAAGAAGVPPMGDPAMMGMAQAAPQPAGAGGTGKPKFDPLMLDYRMYNLQQQLSAIMNALNIEVPPQALIMPPGTMGAPPAEQALPGGPMDPATMQGGGQGGQGGSAISPIEPMQGASPEMAMAGGAGGGGGAPKMASAPWSPWQAKQTLPPSVMEFQKEASANAPVGWQVVMVKRGEGLADTHSTEGNVEEEHGSKKSAPPHKSLNVSGAPGTRPATQAITAGGSKDPLSRTGASDSLGPANKQAVANDFFGPTQGNVGVPVERVAVEPTYTPTQGAAALAAMFRSKTQHGVA